MTLALKRQIMTRTYIGKRHIKEVISSMLSGVILNPQKIWLVSAWISDFEILDNRGGCWDLLNPTWGHRIVTFFDLLEIATLNGCQLNIVVRKHSNNDKAILVLKKKLGKSPLFHIEESKNLHSKGLLITDAFLSGSMNFTYSGANKNEELMSLERDPVFISEISLHYAETYFKSVISEITEANLDDDDDFM
jgi:phosphatidylserine/phosphatidylglycerophosphate/cardiolipin synthase-like enzyme